MKRIVLALSLCFSLALQAQQTQHLFRFNAIPWSAPDIVSPFRGAERWHNMKPNQGLNYPTAAKNEEPLDAYFRSGLSWDRLEKAAGQYTWAAFDELINSCIDFQFEQLLGFGHLFGFDNGSNANVYFRKIVVRAVLFLWCCRC